MMVKVWLYAYSVGIRSSRQVERALYENIGFRILSGDQQPGYWALNNFRRRHMAALGDIFVQTVRLAKQAGLVSMKQVAVEEEARAKAREEQEERRARAEAKGRTYRPRKNPDDAKSKATAQRNFTDPESRIMKGSDGFVQAFNAQAVVDTPSQIVISADLSSQAADSPHLSSLLEQAVENTS